MSIKCSFKYKSFNFPCGERHVVIQNLEDLPITNIVLQYENDAEIMELLLIVDAVKRLGGSIETLHIPYIPYSRQDRINVLGECFSLKVFCDLINSIGAREVLIEDPHSDVTPALLNNCIVINQHEALSKFLYRDNSYCLISPDAGALKKINKLAAMMGRSQVSSVVECSKKRDVKTGEITGTNIHIDTLMGNDCVIVDDICDGGRTFIEIAKELKKKNCGNIVLAVTHAFFTKGLGVFDGLIDEIYTRKGRVK